MKTPDRADTDSAMIPVRIERLDKSFGSAKAVDAAELCRREPKRGEAVPPEQRSAALRVRRFVTQTNR